MRTRLDRKIAWRDGFVHIKGVTEEDYKLALEVLNNSEPRLKPWEQPIDPSKMSNYAYGLTLGEDKNFYLTTMRYNEQLKHCMFENVENLGNNYYIAIGKFKAMLGQKVFDVLMVK